MLQILICLGISSKKNYLWAGLVGWDTALDLLLALGVLVLGVDTDHTFPCRRLGSFVIVKSIISAANQNVFL